MSGPPPLLDAAQPAKRCLLTDNIVQLQEFQQKKLEAGFSIQGKKDEYFRTIEKKLTKNRLIFKDELKTVLHLCQTSDDVELAKKVVYRYHADNRNVSLEFRFGPLFMRLCYELNLESTALELIKDKALHGFFADSTSFNILMDMLFKNGHYECALEVLLEMKNQGVRFNSETYILAFAVCYKLNSSESCKICTTLLEEAQLKGEQLPRRALCFAVASALKQNDVMKAQSFYSQIMSTESRVCSNLKILLQVASGDLEGLVKSLEAISKTRASVCVKKPEFSISVLSTAREKLENDPGLCVRFEETFAKLQTLGQLTPLTLDDLLCRTPHTKMHREHG
ncbi:Pentatricopeptide repeat-containing protein 2, mitochondrial [Varanus komodoensis]|nr:Pentatricopeptide repeat-containing protein 2, mitochondrial [Varanus komodoensis]